MKIKKYAAIDIGSNAVRVLISNVISSKMKSPKFMKSSMVRVPIRLGEDSFTVGEISDKNKKRMVKAMKAFKHIMKISNVTSYMACEIIDGKKEAKIISNTNVFNVVGNEKTFLYVDVGGGSTEFSVLKNGKRIHSKSFKIGTVRLLNDGVTEELWLLAENWVKEKTKEYQKIYLLGTGGNINKLHKMANIKDDRPITYLTLSAMYSKLSKMTYEERIIKLGLNPDRSDVILPAAQLFLKTLNWSGAKVIYVPKVGLSDGMIRELCKKKKMNS